MFVLFLIKYAIAVNIHIKYVIKLSITKIVIVSLYVSFGNPSKPIIAHVLMNNNTDTAITKAQHHTRGIRGVTLFSLAYAREIHGSMDSM
jgi:hypothetical protein